jgi:rSAM/selenodomain-associated transferase 2
MPLVSIITPIFNEKEIILTFLRHLSSLEGDFEIIIVDGGSTDGTRSVIEESLHEFPLVTILSTHKGRSIQMNTGAATAQGEILLFLHADCTIPQDSISEIIRVCSNPKVAGGAFTHTHDEPGVFPGVARDAVNLFSRHTQTFFGDFGIFVKRDIFHRSGGFEEIPYCEDVEFCRSARRFGRMVQIERVIQSSPRRFSRVGRYKLIMVYSLAMLLNMLRVRPQFLYRIIID